VLARAELARARGLIVARDTSAARASLTHALALDPFDPESHGLLADLNFGDPARQPRMLLEAYAALALAPEDARSWRRWAFVQGAYGEMAGGLGSLARYRELAPEAASADRGASLLEAELRRRESITPSGGQLTLD